MNCANDWMHFYGYFLIFIPDTSTRKAHTPKAKQGEGLSVCYGTTDLFHGDYTVSYCHLSKALVKKGAQVLPGEVVAISGNTGRSTGPHLHITVKYGKKHIDPAILLQLVKETREEALAHLVAG